MEYSGKQQQIKLEVIDADITGLRVDAIVNSANTEMRLGGSRAIAGTIVRKTKGQVQKELDDEIKHPKPIPLGGIVVTKGFGLPCKYIFHLATHGARSQSTDDVLLKAISDGIVNSIAKAEELSLQTLAIPLIATGSLGLPIGLAIETHINALSHALNIKQLSSLEEVFLITHKNPDALGQIRILLANLNASRSIQDVKGVGNLLSLQGDAMEAPPSASARYSPQVYEDEGGSFEISPCREEVQELESQLLGARRRIKNLEEELRVALERITLLSDAEKAPGNGALPIAYAYNMVESEISPVIKMEKLRRALGIALRYFASIVFADYHALGCFDNRVNQQCTETFSHPATDGDWLYEMENVVSVYLRENVKPRLIKEIPSLWKRNQKNKSKFAGLCHGLVKLRNEIHDKTSFDDSTAKEWLERAFPLWAGMMKEAVPLLRYQLYFLEALDDFTQEGEIVYRVKWLMGEHLVPRSELVRWAEKLQKGKLYLRDPESGRSLNLSPFMAYEYSSITKTRETYCIDQIAKGKLSFTTLRFPHKEDLPGYHIDIFTKSDLRDLIE